MECHHTAPSSPNPRTHRRAVPPWLLAGHHVMTAIRWVRRSADGGVGGGMALGGPKEPGIGDQEVGKMGEGRVPDLGNKEMS